MDRYEATVEDHRGRVSTQGGGGGDAVNANKMTLVSALDLQHKMLASLSQTIQELEDRLGPILSQRDRPEHPGGGASPTPTALLGRVIMHNQGLDLFGRNLRTLITRLEL